MTLPEIFLTLFCGDEGEQSCLVPGGGGGQRRQDGVEAPQ